MGPLDGISPGSTSQPRAVANVELAIDAPDSVDKAFGVAKAIRDLLHIRSFDADWTLPSRRDRLPKSPAFPFLSELLTIQSFPKANEDEVEKER